MVSLADFRAWSGRRQREANWVRSRTFAGTAALAAMTRGFSGPRFVAGISKDGEYLGDAVAKIDEVIGILATDARLYRQGNIVLYVTPSAAIPRPVVVDGYPIKEATARLSNIIMCSRMQSNATGRNARVDEPAEYAVQYALPKVVIEQVAARDDFLGRLRAVDLVFSHPVFDSQFRWLGAGFHDEQKILVLGDPCEPASLCPAGPDAPPPVAVQDVIDRLPPLLRDMVQEGHWATPVDLTNYIGIAIGILLMPSFIGQHPAVIIWGNKPEIGKSTNAQKLAILVDGEPASVLPLLPSNDKEIEHRMVDVLAAGRKTFFFDNTKGTINSPFIEANVTAPRIAPRIMHTQKSMERPNDVLWIFTTNDGAPSDDLISRSINVRLHYEGVASEHVFRRSDHEVLNFVRENRHGILAELAGWVIRWLEMGRPQVTTPCRFRTFGSVVGSILAANGLPGFNSNAREESQANSPRSQQIVALAEKLLAERPPGFILEVDGGADAAAEAMAASTLHRQEQREWIPALLAVGAIPPSKDTDAKKKSAATAFLKAACREPVQIETDGGTVSAMIVSRSVGQRRVAYALAVSGAALAAPPGDDSEPSVLPLASAMPAPPTGDAGGPSGPATDERRGATGGDPASRPAAEGPRWWQDSRG